MEKIDVQTKQSFHKKKRDTEKANFIQEREQKKKNVLKHENKTKKGKIEKIKNDIHTKQINMKKCPTARKMNKQVFFDSEKCGRKRKNLKMSSPICWMETKNFRIHHNKQAKNAKAGETIFQDTEKQGKTRKVNVKHVQQTKETDKIFFFFLGTQQKKKV